MKKSRVDSILIDCRDAETIERMKVLGASLFAVQEAPRAGRSSGTLRSANMLRVPLDLAIQLGIVKRLVPQS
jgi:hypothetical protein